MKLDLRPQYAKFQLSNAELVELARIPEEPERRKALRNFEKVDHYQPYETSELNAALETFGLSQERIRLEGRQDKVWTSHEAAIYRRICLPEYDPAPAKAENCREFATDALALFDRLDCDRNGHITGTELEQAMRSPDYHGKDSAAVVMLRSAQIEIGRCQADGRGITQADLVSLSEIGVSRDGKNPDEQASHRINLAYAARKAAAQTLSPRQELGAESFDPATLRQGKNGTCVTLCTLLGTNQETVSKMFTTNPDGTIQVKFANGSSETVSDVSVTERLYQASADNGERWPALLETALGQKLEKLGQEREFEDRFPRSFNAAGQHYEDAYRLILGRSCEVQKMTFISPNLARTMLTQALPLGPVVAGSHDGTRNGIVGNHAYAVQGYNAERDTVQLRNPWKNQEWAGVKDGQDDGRFEMPFLQFYASFEEVAYPREAGLLRQSFEALKWGVRHALGATMHAFAQLIPWER